MSTYLLHYHITPLHSAILLKTSTLLFVGLFFVLGAFGTPLYSAGRFHRVHGPWRHLPSHFHSPSQFPSWWISWSMPWMVHLSWAECSNFNCSSPLPTDILRRLVCFLRLYPFFLPFPHALFSGSPIGYLTQPSSLVLSMPSLVSFANQSASRRPLADMDWYSCSIEVPDSTKCAPLHFFC